MSEPSPITALLLGIDTSGSTGSLAIGRLSAHGDVELVAQSLLSGRHYAEEVVPQLKALLSQTSLILSQLDAIAIVNGPGSFTGLRAGIAAVKALAEAAALPVIAISRLALLANMSKRDTVAVLDGGRGEYYIRLAHGEESIESASSLLDYARMTGITICEASLQTGLAPSRVQLTPSPTAFDAIRYAASRFVAQEFADVATLDANYVRRPYAVPPGLA